MCASLEPRCWNIRFGEHQLQCKLTLPGYSALCQPMLVSIVSVACGSRHAELRTRVPQTLGNLVTPGPRALLLKEKFGSGRYFKILYFLILDAFTVFSKRVPFHPFENHHRYVVKNCWFIQSFRCLKFKRVWERLTQTSAITSKRLCRALPRNDN